MRKINVERQFCMIVATLCFLSVPVTRRCTLSLINIFYPSYLPDLLPWSGAHVPSGVRVAMRFPSQLETDTKQRWTSKDVYSLLWKSATSSPIVLTHYQTRPKAHKDIVLMMRSRKPVTRRLTGAMGEEIM